MTAGTRSAYCIKCQCPDACFDCKRYYIAQGCSAGRPARGWWQSASASPLAVAVHDDRYMHGSYLIGILFSLDVGPAPKSQQCIGTEIIAATRAAFNTRWRPLRDLAAHDLGRENVARITDGANEGGALRLLLELVPQAEYFQIRSYAAGGFDPGASTGRSSHARGAAVSDIYSGRKD